MWAAAVTFVTSAIEAFSNALFSLVADWMFLIGILIAAALALLWNLTHDIILGTLPCGFSGLEINTFYKSVSNHV